MHLERLKLQNFRCYDNLDIDFDPRLTVIVGENGKGKTAIFDALAIAFAPFMEAFGKQGRKIQRKDVRRVPVYKEDGMHIAKMETRYPLVITLEGTGLKNGSKVTCTRKLTEESGWEENEENLFAYGTALRKDAGEHKNVVLPCLAYYGTSRIWVDSKLLEHYDRSLEDRAVGYEECLEPSSSYNTFGRWFEHITKCAQQDLQNGISDSRNVMIKKAIQQAIDVCLGSTGFNDLYFNYELNAFVISHPDLGEMIVDDLSDGFRSIISMVADLAYRMVRLNPFLGEQAVVDTPGMVLIDEIDMHLHPLWQQVVLLDLEKAFPKLQFIVTTHSPQVLSSVPAEGIRVLNWGKKGFEGVSHVEFSLGAASTQLLQDIQHVNPRSRALPIVKDLERYLELVSEDKWDSEEALTLRKRLDEWSRGREPALLRADMDIRMRQFRRKRHEARV